MSYAPLMGDSNMRFQTTWLLISAVSLGVLLQACEPDTPIVVDDGGVADANVDGCVIVECAAPPMGCRYEGGDPCTSCGAIVCPDAAVATVCEACPGTVVAPYPGTFGYTAMCPAGELVDFAGTQTWVGPGLDLTRLACAVDNTGFEPSFSICCLPDPRMDAGMPDAAVPDAGATDAGSALCLGVLCGSGTHCDDATGACVPDGPSGCDPASAAACGAGMSCCYPCGIPGCAYQCEPSCAPGSPGCAGGCVARP